MKTLSYDDDALGVLLAGLRDEGKDLYFDLPDSDCYRYDTLDKAVEIALDDWDSADFVEGAVLTIEVVTPVSVVGYTDPKALADELLERYDEEFGDPDGEYTDAWKALLDDAKAFVNELERRYVPRMCEVVVRVEVPVLPWIRQHQPDRASGGSTS